MSMQKICRAVCDKGATTQYDTVDDGTWKNITYRGKEEEADED